MNAEPNPACPLCHGEGGRLVWQGERAGAKLRVVHADEAGFPAFYRVIWAAHVAEFSDLSAAERQWCMDAVVAVEVALRGMLPAPRKINIATLGNMVPHLHWHVIARFDWDSHFPAPVWASALRHSPAAQQAGVSARLPVLEAALQSKLGQLA